MNRYRFQQLFAVKLSRPRWRKPTRLITRQQANLWLTLLVCLSISLSLGIRSQVAQAQTGSPADGFYILKSVATSKCVEPVSHAGASSGIWQWTCNPSTTYQHWQLAAVGNGYYQLRNVESSQTLSVLASATYEAASIWQSATENTLYSQNWKLVRQSDGSYQLVAAHSNKCASLIIGGTYEGAILLQYTCNSSASQRFTLTPVARPALPTTSQLNQGHFIFQAAHTGKCMDSLAAYGLVQQWTCLTDIYRARQQWLAIPTGDGYFKLKNVNGGQVLSVSSSMIEDGINIYQWPDTNLNSQKWLPVPQSDGTYQLMAFHSNKCMAVANAGIYDGSLMVQAACGTGTNQRFKSAAAPVGLNSLKGVSIVEDSNINLYIADRQAAKVLGKALFWDSTVGSDGQTACATCHFHAGADVRTKNQLSPDLNNLTGAPANATFNPTASGNAGGVNYRLTTADFPFFRLSDPNNRDSSILFQTDDVASSQGVYSERYVDTTPGNPADQCALVPDNRFHLGVISTRRVEPRNTPTMINAVFNLRNFWDGRANETFNGVNPFGTRDTSAGIYKFTGFSVAKVQPQLRFSSLASQAVGPPLSDFEMSCAQRLWPNVGHRLLSRIALQSQQVASNDSLLAPYRSASGMGLNLTYQQLIDKAFKPEYRNNGWQVSLNGINYPMTEANFSFFFGLAVQLYEATLVSNDSPIDRYISSNDYSALTSQEQRGMNIFTDKGKCISCHSGATLSNAAIPAIDDYKRGAIVSHMIAGDGARVLYDEGFYNIGVRPTVEDIGVGGNDPFGNPLSFSAQYKAYLQSFKPFVDKSLTVNPCTFEVQPCVIPPASTRLAVDGAFKVPNLRNVSLTGPFFHNGSRSTLEQVVEFYNRGGDRRGTSSNNTSGWGSNGSNLDADIQPLGLSASEKADLVAFLKRPLLDNRVACDQAPFDHPQLTIPNGHVGNNLSVVDDGTGRAVNEFFTIPAIGASGSCSANLAGQRMTFEQILANNGSLANAATSQSTESGSAVFTVNTPSKLDGEKAPVVPVVEPPVETVTFDGPAEIVLEAQAQANPIDDGNAAPAPAPAPTQPSAPATPVAQPGGTAIDNPSTSNNKLYIPMTQSTHK